MHTRFRSDLHNILLLIVSISSKRNNEKGSLLIVCTFLYTQLYRGRTILHKHPSFRKNMYLNRCWHCYEIIDSREAPFRVDPVTGFVSMENGHFICLHCASAPKKHKVYRQGDYCPKCGDSPMLHLNESEFQCKTCFHKIIRPESRKLTGFEKTYVKPYFNHL